MSNSLSVDEISKKKRSNYINFAIVFGVMVMSHFIPAPAPLTPLGVQIIGLFIGLIYGWAKCGILWPSLLGILMLGFTDFGVSPQNSLGMALTNYTALSMLTALIAFNYIISTGLTNVVANWLVTRKFAVGKPWQFMCFFFGAGLLLSCAFNPIVLIIVAYGFMDPLLKQMGYTKEDKFPTYLYLGIAISFSTCSVIFPFMPNALYTKGVIMSSLGANISTLQYLICIGVPSVTMVITYILMGKFLLRIDTTKFVEGSNLMLEQMQKNEKKGLTREEKSGALVLIIFVLGVALPAILPSTWPIISTLKRLDLIGVSMAIVIAVIVLMKKDGTPVADFSKLMGDTEWGMLLLTAMIMTIASALTSEGTGVVAFLNMTVVPVIAKLPLGAFVAVVMIVMCIMSQVSMNMVLQMIFCPILATILANAGYNPMIAVMAVMFGSQLAFMAPSGSMMAAMVFAKDDWVKPTHIYKIVLPWIFVTMIIWFFMVMFFPGMVF